MFTGGLISFWQVQGRRCSSYWLVLLRYGCMWCTWDKRGILGSNTNQHSCRIYSWSCGNVQETILQNESIFLLPLYLRMKKNLQQFLYKYYHLTQFRSSSFLGSVSSSGSSFAFPPFFFPFPFPLPALVWGAGDFFSFSGAVPSGAVRLPKGCIYNAIKY